MLCWSRAGGGGGEAEGPCKEVGGKRTFSRVRIKIVRTTEALGGTTRIN